MPPRFDFDREFAAASRVHRRTFGAMLAIVLIWVLFLIGAFSTVIWLAGRWIGTW